MLNEKLTLCLSSFNSALGDRAANLERIEEEAAKAAEAQAQLLLTSECSVCGHAVGPEVKKAIEPLQGPSLERLTALARKFDLYISAGIAEESSSPEGWPYNTQLLLGPGGLVSKQRKLHLSQNEQCFFQPGEILEHAELGPWRIGTVVCYDNLFIELHRILALRGCELILAPHAIRCGDPTGKDLAAVKASVLAQERTHLQGLASANVLFIAFVNQVGIAGRCASKQLGGWVAHGGGLLVAGPDGALLAESPRPAAQPERVVVTLDRALAVLPRAKAACNLYTRRPELFGELSDARLRDGYRTRYQPPAIGGWWAEEGREPPQGQAHEKTKSLL